MTRTHGAIVGSARYAPGMPSEDLPGARLGRALLLLAIPAVGGCGSRPPAVTAQEIVVETANADASRATVQLSPENPNDNDLILDLWEYQATADRRFDGRRRVGLTLPPRATVTTSVPAILGPAASGLDVRVNGVVTYVGTRDIELALYRAGWIHPEASFAGTSRAK